VVLGNDVKEYKVDKRFFNHFAARDGLLLATPEKAFADCLNVPRSCPSVVLVEAITRVDLSKVKELCSLRGLKRLKVIGKYD
jgi:hypothetical protein